MNPDRATLLAVHHCRVTSRDTASVAFGGIGQHSQVGGKLPRIQTDARGNVQTVQLVNVTDVDPSGDRQRQQVRADRMQRQQIGFVVDELLA
jgi:hypothetical protein